MRLWIDGDVFVWQRAGGISRIYERVLPRLERIDPGVDIRVALAGRPVVPPPEGNNILCTRVMQVPDTWRPWRFWSGVRPVLNARLRDAFWRRCRGDVFHSTYYTAPPVSFPSVCFVYDMVNELFPEMFEPAFIREMRQRKEAAVNAARLVLCISHSTRQDLTRIMNIPEEKCRVVHLAGFCSDEPEPEEDGTREPPCVRFLLYVGDYISPYKNFPFLLKALEGPDATAFADLDLWVVSTRKPTDAEVRQYDGILPGDRVRFVTDCGDARLRVLYRDCAAFVYPSLYEGFGITVLEALGQGAPVVCSDNPAFREVGGEAVHTFDPRSPESFRCALDRALREGRDDPHPARRRRHAASFSWDRTAAGFLDTFREACGA